MTWWNFKTTCVAHSWDMNYAQWQTLLWQIEFRLLWVCLGPQSIAIDSLEVLACFFLGTPWIRASRWQNQDHEPWMLHFFVLLSTLGCVLLSQSHKCHQQKWPSILFPTHSPPPPPTEFHSCSLFLFIITCSETKTPSTKVSHRLFDGMWVFSQEGGDVVQFGL